MKKYTKIILILLALIMLLSSCTWFSKKSKSIEVVEITDDTPQKPEKTEVPEGVEKLEEAEKPVEETVQIYTSKEDVASYINTHGKLPDNFVTKSEAIEAGWEARKGNLAEVLPGKSIGGDVFGNREGKLPKKKGRKYYECDIDYASGHRGAKRIVFSNDGLIFYTDDHYETFEQLYPEKR